MLVSTAGMFPYVPQTDDVVAFLEAVYVTPVCGGWLLFCTCVACVASRVASRL